MKKKTHTFLIPLLSWALSFGAVHAAWVYTIQCDRNCFAESRLLADGFNHAWIDGPGLAVGGALSIDQPTGCCDIEKCESQPFALTGALQSSLTLPSPDIGVASLLSCHNNNRLSGNLNQYKPGQNIPIYTFIQSYLC